MRIRKRVLLYLFLSALAILLSGFNFASAQKPSGTAKMPYVKGVSAIKHPDDPDKSEFLSSASLPFSLVVFIENPENYQITEKAILILEICDFYPRDETRVLTTYATIDLETLSFTIEDLLYTGASRMLLFSMQDINFSRQFSYIVSETVLGPGVGDGSGESSLSETSEKSTAIAPLSPHILISEYSYPSACKINSPFALSFTIRNTSESIDLANILISFPSKESGRNGLLLYDMVNTKFISSLKAGATIKIEISCYLSQKTQNSALDVEIDFEYYENGKTLKKASDKAVLQLRFEQAAALRLEQIIVPEGVYVGLSFPLSYRIANISNANVEHADLAVFDGDVELARVYLGEIKAGQIIDKPEIFLYFEEEKERNLRLVLFYQDGSEATKNISAEFALRLAPPPSEEEEAEPRPTSTLYIEPAKDKASGLSSEGVAISVAVIMLSVSVYVVWQIISGAKKKESAKPFVNLLKTSPPKS